MSLEGVRHHPLCTRVQCNFSYCTLLAQIVSFECVRHHQGCSFWTCAVELHYHPLHWVTFSFEQDCKNIRPMKMRLMKTVIMPKWRNVHNVTNDLPPLTQIVSASPKTDINIRLKHLEEVDDKDGQDRRKQKGLNKCACHRWSCSVDPDCQSFKYHL